MIIVKEFHKTRQRLRRKKAYVGLYPVIARHRFISGGECSMRNIILEINIPNFKPGPIAQ
jgi:hypothetical protein